MGATLRSTSRPRLSPRGFKAHGLGNDYLVFEAGDGWTASAEAVARVCDPHVGIGSDGIVAMLSAQAQGPEAEVQLRMFNPDGGEFERSGNGLRVLAAHVVRRFPDVRRVVAHVGGDVVPMEVHGVEAATWDISVDMGRARVGGDHVGMDVPAFSSDVADLDLVPVSVGNPHLVVFEEGGAPVTLDEAALSRIGPRLTTHPALRAGSNVQLAAPVGAGRAQALIWERGVGPTSASGTSACAVAVACVSTGRLAPGTIEVVAPGGSLWIEVSEALDVVLRGPVEEVYEVELTPAFAETLGS